MTPHWKNNGWVSRLGALALGCALSTTSLVVWAAPSLVTDTQPVTAVDVVGSALKFTATFNSSLPLTYQWQVLHNGTTNDIPAATSSTLVLTDLTTNDTGNYRLKATDASGQTFSAARALTVNPPSAPVGNFITTPAAQTGLGSSGTKFTPTWTFAPGSLIAGRSPSNVGSGNFSQYGAGAVSVLTDNSFGYFNYVPNVGGSPTEVTCGTSGGTSVTYTLPTSPNGYDLTNVVVYGGWGDAGRDQQAYTIYSSTVSSPSSFSALTSVNYNPANPANVQCASRVSVSPASVAPLARNVAAVKFDFTSPPPENGYCGYSEISLFGRPAGNPPVANVPSSSPSSPVAAGTTVTFTESASGTPPFSYQWQTDSGSAGAAYTDLPGATNASLVLDTTGFGNFTLNYRVRVGDVNGATTSPAVLLTVTNASSTNSLMAVQNLRCEYLSNPLGIDATRPRLSWQLNDPQRGARQTAYQILVASSPTLLSQDQGDLWASGPIISDQSVLVPYGGQTLASGQLCYWKVRVWDRDGNYSVWSAPAQWSMGLLQPTDWTASWIGMATDTNLTPAAPSPMLRKTFAVSKPVARATVYVCGLGYYELQLNGAKVGDHVLDPAWTRYDYQAEYVTYDITTNLVSGANAVGLQLANGFYNQWSTDAWNTYTAPWRALPQLLLQLDIQYTDGTSQRVVSDPTWKASTGPLLLDATRLGEVYDARLEKPNWATADYDDSAWTNAILREGIAGKLIAPNAEPVKAGKTLVARRIIPVTGQPGVYTFDFGQNLVGWGRLSVSGPAGTTVTMVFGEKTNANGSVDQGNINVYVNSQRAYFQKDIYTLKGGGTETWEPRFTYHGFQYVQVSGLPSTPTISTLVARVVNTAFEPAGTFLCSNDLLNRVETNTLWSYLGNFVGIPTDCPHREKNGWLGDAQLACEIGLTHFQSAAAYTRWIRDFGPAQMGNGGGWGVIPNANWGANEGPPWESAYLFIPWFVYQHCGDVGILTNNYAGMKAYVDYLTSQASGNTVSFGLGDWEPASATTSTALTGTAYYYQDALIVAYTAGLMGDSNTSLQYSNLAVQIKGSFNRAFLNTNTFQYSGGTQTAQSSALYHGLVETNNTAGVAGALATVVQQNNNRIDTGILGSKYLLRSLCDNGRADTALALTMQTNYPGWGYWITAGATTLWETWNGTGSIDSLNHVMFGDISAWFIQYAAGIRPGAPGYKQVLIKPELMNGLAWAKATHDGPYGTISSAWQLNGQLATLNVTFPPGTTGRVYLPLLGTPSTNLVVQESGTTIWQNGTPTGNVPEVTFDRLDDSQRFLVWDTEAGTYQFTWQVAIPVPGNLTAIADNHVVKLSWNVVPGAIGYNLKRAPTGSGPFVTLTNATAALGYTDAAVTNDLTYYYVVSSVTTNGQSADSAPVSAKPVLDVNFGFEKLRVSNYQYNPSGAIWSFNGTTGNGSGLIANGSAFSNPDAPEGVQAAFVQQFGALSQTLSGFSPGIRYTLTFSAAQRSGANQQGGQSWNVKIDNNIIGSYNPGPGATTYVDYTASFVATATNHTLTFVGTDLVGGDNTVFIDHVRFSPPIPPVNPQVVLTSPTNQSALLAPATVNLAATVVSNGNFISSVQFYSNTTHLLGEDFAPPYVFGWSNIDAGYYQLRARVLFNGSNAVDSAVVNVLVTNLPPVIQSAGQGGTGFFLTGTGQPSRPMVLLNATNLQPPVYWAPLATNPSDADGRFTFSNLTTGNPQQFYRVTTQ